MSKGKPRHNPDKPANRRNTHCPYYEDIEGRGYCSALMGAIPTDPKCNGNRHHCIKVQYQHLASL